MTGLVMDVDAWAFCAAELRVDPLRADLECAEKISDGARRVFVARSRTILRRVLGLRLGLRPEDVEWTVEQAGKPRIAGCEFSVSHSGPWLVIATGESELGVDIETRIPRRDVMELAQRFFSRPDAEALACAKDRPRAFLAQWVAKEAALKCSGIGIAGGLLRAECIFEGDEIREVICGADGFSIHEFILRDGVPGAIALRNGRRAMVTWRDASDAGIS